MPYLPPSPSLLATSLALSLAACSVTGPRESPLNEVTANSPTVLNIYRGSTASKDSTELVRDALQGPSPARPIKEQDGTLSRYWNPLEPLRSRFSKVPNPDLVMVVFPHLAKGKYPVPGYVTAFPMYEQTPFALPGEIEQDAVALRQRFEEQRNNQRNSQSNSQRNPLRDSQRQGSQATAPEVATQSHQPEVWR